MYLVKSCSHRFNITRSRTIKLGTLSEYRKTEIQQIADKYEGTLDYTVHLKGTVEIPILWANTLAAGSIQTGREPGIRFPGRMRAYVIRHEVVNRGLETVTLKDSCMVVERESPNGFIFCMSCLEAPEQATGLFPEYDDYWHINFDKAKDFATGISQALFEKINDGHYTGNHILPPQIDISTLQIRARWEHVRYVPRDITITSANKEDLDYFFDAMEYMAFTKPPEKFESEHEYRFEFTLISGDMIVEPLVDSLVINAEPVLGLATSKRS